MQRCFRHRICTGLTPSMYHFTLVCMKHTRSHIFDYRMRQALNHGIIDAPSNQGFAGLYEGYEFPNDDQHPLNGFCRSRLFVDVRAWTTASTRTDHVTPGQAALGIFIGPRASKRLPIAARGRRSKAAVSGMTSITKSAIAYVAMLVRHIIVCARVLSAVLIAILLSSGSPFIKRRPGIASSPQMTRALIISAFTPRCWRCLRRRNSSLRSIV